MTTNFLNFGPELDTVAAAVARIDTEIKTLASSVSAIDKLLMTDLAEIIDKLDKILTWPAPNLTPTRVRFVVPTFRDIYTGLERSVATSLINDAISNIPLEFDNIVGRRVDPPSAGTVTLTVNPPEAATAAMGSDGASVDVTPTPSDGTNTTAFTLTFDDKANADLSATLDCVFTQDQNAANVHFVTTGITTRPISGP